MKNSILDFSSSNAILKSYFWILMLIQLIVGGCAIDPISLGVGLGQRIAREMREEIIIGKPRKARKILLSYKENNNNIPDNDIRYLEAYLESLLKDILKVAKEIERSSKSVTPYHNIQPRISLKLNKNLRPCAHAKQGKNPEIEICIGYLMNLAFEKNLYGELFKNNPFSEKDGNQLIEFGTDILWSYASSRMASMMEELDNNMKTIEFQEAVLFSLAHEFTHIWLDPPSYIQNSRENNEAETRADSYGVILGMYASPAVRRKAELHARFVRTWHLSFSDPLDMALYAAEYGQNTLFNVYENYCFKNTCFQDGDKDHMPIKERLKKTATKKDLIMSEIVSNKDEKDLVYNYVTMSIKDALLGYSGSASN